MPSNAVDTAKTLKKMIPVTARTKIVRLFGRVGSLPDDDLELIYPGLMVVGMPPSRACRQVRANVAKMERTEDERRSENDR